MMKTVSLEVKFLDPDHRPSEQEMEEMLKGNCPACHKNESVALQTSDEFTDFYVCHECNLCVHHEVIEIILGKKVPNTRDVINDTLKMLSSDNPDRRGFFKKLEAALEGEK